MNKHIKNVNESIKRTFYKINKDISLLFNKTVV